MMQSPSDIMLALAEFSGIEIPAAYRPGVIGNLALIQAHMQQVMAFPIPEDIAFACEDRP